MNKINVHRIFNLHFFYGHRVSCLWFIKHYQTKKNWKNNAMFDHKIPSLSYGSGCFFKTWYYYTFNVFKMKKLNIISSKISKLLNYAQKWLCCLHHNNYDVFFLKTILDRVFAHEYVGHKLHKSYDFTSNCTSILSSFELCILLL